MKREAWIHELLAGLLDKHLERKLVAMADTGGKLEWEGRSFLNFSCNDYLNLASHPTVIARAAAALLEFGAGATASRLVTGSLTLHEELETRLARFKGYPAALMFGSGYHTSTGAIPTLVGREDTVFADRLAHASLLDGAVLSRAHLVRFQHNNPEHLEKCLQQADAKNRRLIVTESVFSMDGDLAPLDAIAELAVRHGALLMVDEAHATGVFGPSGSGLVSGEKLHDKVNVAMGTLSKALGGYGGFVTCSTAIRDLLINRSRAFIYTTASPPSVIGAALGALDVLESEPDLGAQLLQRATTFRERLRALGFNTLQSASQIIPVLVGDNAKTLAFARRLRDQGILAVAIRPPTVPEGTARLRLSVTLAHTADDLAVAADAIAAAAREEHIL